MYKERQIGGYIRWKTASTQLQSLNLYFCLPHFLPFNVPQFDFFFLELLFLLEKSDHNVVEGADRKEVKVVFGVFHHCKSVHLFIVVRRDRVAG